MLNYSRFNLVTSLFVYSITGNIFNLISSPSIVIKFTSTPFSFVLSANY